MLADIWIQEQPIIDGGEFSHPGNPLKEYYVKPTTQVNVPWSQNATIGVYNEVTEEFDFTGLEPGNHTMYEMGKGFPFPFDKKITTFTVT